MLFEWVSRLTAVLCAALVLAIAGYASLNGSGHTSLRPYDALWLFVPTAVVGVAGIALPSLTGGRDWSPAAALMAGLLGVALLVYLDWSNTLLNYDVWIERGMPE